MRTCIASSWTQSLSEFLSEQPLLPVSMKLGAVLESKARTSKDGRYPKYVYYSLQDVHLTGYSSCPNTFGVSVLVANLVPNNITYNILTITTNAYKVLKSYQHSPLDKTEFTHS